jgi:hypothetical protein
MDTWDGILIATTKDSGYIALMQERAINLFSGIVIQMMERSLLHGTKKAGILECFAFLKIFFGIVFTLRLIGLA